MLEAGLCGLPIVAADLEGIRDVVAAGKNGVLVPSGDAEAFARAILRFRGDDESLQRSATAARRTTIDRFSWPVVTERYVEVLRDARGGGMRAGG